nr:hypothetical protein [Bacteroidaceae bacterium]
TITNSKSTATFTVFENNSTGQVLNIFVTGSGIVAQKDAEKDDAAYLTAQSTTSSTIKIISNGQVLSKTIRLTANRTIHIYVEDGSIKSKVVKNPSATNIDSDKTHYIKNPSFEANTTKGWEGTTMTADYNEVEKFNANFDFHQTLTDLPAGAYELSCQGFYRNGSYENAASTHANGTETLNALLYATSSASEEQTTPLPSIIDEAGKKGALGVKPSTYGHIPNTMEEASAYFASGLYPVSLQVAVGDNGQLTIGVKKSTQVNSDWTIFDNFRLTYLGNAIKGDVDNDGLRSVNDLQTLIKVVLNLQEDKYNRYAIDINSNGNVSLGDATLLVNMLNNP